MRYLIRTPSGRQSHGTEDADSAEEALRKSGYAGSDLVAVPLIKHRAENAPFRTETDDEAIRRIEAAMYETWLADPDHPERRQETYYPSTGYVSYPRMGMVKLS